MLVQLSSDFIRKPIYGSVLIQGGEGGESEVKIAGIRWLLYPKDDRKGYNSVVAILHGMNVTPLFHEVDRTSCYIVLA